MKPAPARATLWDFVLYFLKLGTWGFGGPIALAGYMQRDLVDERGWIAPDDYKQGLALAQLAPGPARGPTRHLPRLGSWPRVGRDTRRNRVRGAVVPDGARPLGAVPQVRWARLDAGAVLRHWSRGHRDYRVERRETCADHSRAGPIALGNFRDESHRHGLDGEGDHLGFRGFGVHPPARPRSCTTINAEQSAARRAVARVARIWA